MRKRDMSIGLRLRQLRKAKGWRLIDLAVRFSRPIDPTRISKWENGHETPRVEALVELAKILDCTLDCLLSLSPCPVTEERIVVPRKRVSPPSERTNKGTTRNDGSLSSRARFALYRADLRTSEQVLALGDQLIYVRGIWKRLAAEIEAYAKAHPGETFPAQ